MKPNIFLMLGMVLASLVRIPAQVTTRGEQWPNLDRRNATVIQPSLQPGQETAAARNKEQIRGLQIEFDPRLETPKSVYSIISFLSDPEQIYDPNASPPSPHGAPPIHLKPLPDWTDRHRNLKRFLNDNADLFGYDAGILNSTRITRESVTPHSQLRTVVWQQELDGVPVFEATLIANFTRTDILISLSGQVVPDLNRAVRVNAALITAADALASAARNIGETAAAPDFAANDEPLGNARKQKFLGESIVGEAETSLVWLPMDRTTLRLCWRVVLTGSQSRKLFQVLIDAARSETLVRHCWTSSAIEATYRVFDKDSAAPLLPGWSTPLTNQASVTTQVNLTLTALSTNASPAGWVNTNASLFGLTNTTFGNNVDAHLDWLNTDPSYGTITSATPPRPVGVLTNGRVEFIGSSFTVDFGTATTNSPNRDAAMANAFFWCNWMHDVLYELGFTESAGNFQYDNFGRGGSGGDAVVMEVQNSAGLGIIGGGGGSSASPQDGGPGQVYAGIWGDNTSERDGDFDVTLLLHEYTHLLAWRLVGGGAGISAEQTIGLSEGWSDFYALALLNKETDDRNGIYPILGYVSYHLKTVSFEQNYYFGARAYPYSTDMMKSPMTFGDLQADPAFDPHPGIPLSSIYQPTNTSIAPYPLNEPHTWGQIWCTALWDARDNFIQKHGFGNGNWLILQLVTDGMKRVGKNPNFLQARDKILEAEMVIGGRNELELWTAFAKRGMGYSATNAPSDFERVDGFPVRESFSIPPFAEITNGIYSSPAIGADGTVYVGSTNGRLYAINNSSTNEFPGTVKWSFGGLTTNQPFSSSPTISPTGVIYAGCSDSNLHAIASSGATIWHSNLGDEIFSSPALATDGTIYVGSGNGKLYAVNPDGTVKWATSSTGSNILSSPVVAMNGTVYVGSMHPSTNLYGFNPTNGSVLSGWPVTVTNGVRSSPAIGSDGSVYVGGLDGKVYAFTTNGSPKSGWPVTTGGAIWSSPAIGSNGVVYIGSTDSNLYAINPNGTTNWTYKTRGAVKSSPALGRNGTVFVGSDDFNLHVINADGTSRWQYPIGGPVFSSPVIGPEGGLFVGSTAGNLYYLPTGTPFADGPWSMFRQNFRHTANAKTLILRTPQATNGTWNIEISGPVGTQCEVEVTTNLPASWTSFSTLTLTNGVGLIQTSSTNAQRYYRARFTD